MSLKNGVWYDAVLDPPGAEHINKPVLAVRRVGAGKNSYDKIDFAIYNASLMHAPSCTWDGKWNKRGVLYWMPLPKIPGEDDTDGK